MAEALGASLSIDITDLKAGLSAANQAIRETNSEWQAAAAEMDDASHSQEGLEAQIKRLNKNIPVQKEVVRALQAEYDRLIADGLDPTSKQASDMRVKINNATKALNESEKQLRNATQELRELNEASEKGGKGMGALGGIAKGAAIGVGAITAAAASAVTAFIGLAESTRESRTELAKLKQNADAAGVGFENIQDKISDVTAVTGDADAAMEGLNMLMATGLDTSQIEYAADALTGASMKFDGLNFEAMSEGLQESLAVGEAVGGFAELIERNGDSLEDFNAGLAATTTEAEKQQYVMDYLSKSGLKELNDSYKETNKDIVEANEAAYNMEQTMNELGAVAEPISTIFKNMGATLLQGFLPTLKELAGAFQSLVGGDVEGGLSQINTMFDGIVASAGNLVTSLVSKVGELLPVIMPKIAELLSSLVQTLVGMTPTLLSAASQLFLGIVQAIPPTITLLLAELPKIAESVLSALSEAAPIILDAAEQAFMALVDALPSVLSALGESLPQILQKIIDFLTNSAPNILDKAIDVLMNIVSAIPSIVSALAQNLPKIVTSITSTLAKNAPNILSAAVKMLGKIVSAVPQIARELLGNVPQIITSIVKGLASGYDALFDIGKDMLKGLWEGMKSLGGWIWDKISGFFNKTIVGGIKKLLGIASPSKVFAEMGAFSAQGYAEGFEDSMNEAKQGIYDAMDFNPDPTGRPRGGSPAAAAGGGRGVVYFTQNNYSPKALSRTEIYRQTKNAAALIPTGG